LRELEGLARRDVGAWWLCGGHQPDHSTIGKFIVLHSEVLTDEFFVTLVKHLVARMRLGPTLTAGDGRIIDAAAWRFRLLRVGAAQQAAQEMAHKPQPPGFPGTNFPTGHPTFGYLLYRPFRKR
jgi:hypothetical protein